MFKFLIKYYSDLLIIWLLFAMASGLAFSTGMMWALFILWVSVLIGKVIIDKVVAQTEELDQEIG
ncbi:hypothetical protein PBI_GRAYSON_133 [Rhodococcus phage Grayson]|nr:hypothetical protein PBI_GRAYSON_133 [Rhodococcus phage Grayson]